MLQVSIEEILETNQTIECYTLRYYKNEHCSLWYAKYMANVYGPTVPIFKKFINKTVKPIIKYMNKVAGEMKEAARIIGDAYNESKNSKDDL